MNTIEKRKTQHILLCLQKENWTNNKNDFENYRFEHNALPELDFNEIDTTIEFLGKKLSYPFLISSITGGCEHGLKINQPLGKLAQKFNIALALGSQRAALLDKTLIKTFDLRKIAPNILLLANLGAVQLNYELDLESCQQMVDMINADALILHLNPLQEVFQPEGDTNFSGLLKKIEKICHQLSVPVIVKEVGCGINAKVAQRLSQVGVKIIDIAGSGSISWSNVEAARSNDSIIKAVAENFRNWGNSTAFSLEDIAQKCPELSLIASGGIHNGIDVAKAISLGAKLGGFALPLLKTLQESEESAENFIKTIIFELKTTMFCTGSKNLTDLRMQKLIKT